MANLREQLANWMDEDCARHLLAVHLGIFPEGPSEDPWDVFRENKWVYWTENPLGAALWEMMNHLVSIGAMEYDPEDLRFRWKPEYTPE